MTCRVMDLAVVGGGPAGLRAAEVAADGGARVVLYDAMPSVGRKFLVAGRGGLNLTHAEAAGAFAARYAGTEVPVGMWEGLLGEFGPEAVRDWAAGLGVETFAARTGRVYPVGMKAAPLLRRWVGRLRSLGVGLSMRHRWCGIERMGGRWSLSFDTPQGGVVVEADAVVLAMGGGSWPQTGSDGRWVEGLRRVGVEVADLHAANCGWEVDWPEELLARVEGQPMKNLRVAAGDELVSGELLITRYGLEGGALYQLGRSLRGMERPEIRIDLKPTFSVDELAVRLAGVAQGRMWDEAVRRWRLTPAGEAVWKFARGDRPVAGALELAESAKSVALPLMRPRPLQEAISSAGGVAWPAVADDLMVRSLPGVFVAGEMIDWEAPTGGYLLQGCFATGTRAGAAALRWWRNASAAELE